MTADDGPDDPARPGRGQTGLPGHRQQRDPGVVPIGRRDLTDLDPTLRAAFRRAFIRPLPLDVGARHLWRLYNTRPPQSEDGTSPPSPSAGLRARLTTTVLIAALLLPGLLGALSSSAIPGDWLYAVKRHSEEWRLARAVTWEDRDGMLRRQAEARLWEAEALAAQRPAWMGTVVDEIVEVVGLLATSPSPGTRGDVQALQTEIAERLETVADTAEEPARERIILAVEAVTAPRDDNAPPDRDARMTAQADGRSPGAAVALHDHQPGKGDLEGVNPGEGAAADAPTEGSAAQAHVDADAPEPAPGNDPAGRPEPAGEGLADHGSGAPGPEPAEEASGAEADITAEATGEREPAASVAAPEQSAPQPSAAPALREPMPESSPGPDDSALPVETPSPCPMILEGEPSPSPEYTLQQDTGGDVPDHDPAEEHCPPGLPASAPTAEAPPGRTTAPGPGDVILPETEKRDDVTQHDTARAPVQARGRTR